MGDDDVATPAASAPSTTAKISSGARCPVASTMSCRAISREPRDAREQRAAGVDHGDRRDSMPGSRSSSSNFTHTGICAPGRRRAPRASR